MIGNEQHFVELHAGDFGGLGVGRVMRFKGASRRHRNNVIKANAVMGARRFEHVGVAVRQNRQFIAPAQHFHRRRHIGKRFEFFDLCDQPAHFFFGVRNAGAFERVGHGNLANAAIGNMFTLQQGIDHRVFKMRAPPPRDEGIGTTRPAFFLQKRRGHFDQARLHVDYRAVLVEHQQFDVAFQIINGGHRRFSL